MSWLRCGPICQNTHIGMLLLGPGLCLCQVRVSSGGAREHDVAVINGHRLSISMLFAFDIEVKQRVSAVHLVAITAGHYVCYCVTARPRDIAFMGLASWQSRGSELQHPVLFCFILSSQDNHICTFAL